MLSAIPVASSVSRIAPRCSSTYEMDEFEIANQVADNPAVVTQLFGQARAFFTAHAAQTAALRASTAAASAVAKADTSDPLDV